MGRAAAPATVVAALVFPGTCRRTPAVALWVRPTPPLGYDQRLPWGTTNTTSNTAASRRSSRERPRPLALSFVALAVVRYAAGSST